MTGEAWWGEGARERGSERVIDWLSGWVIEWLIDWLIEWVSEWVREWVSEWVRVCVSVCLCVYLRLVHSLTRSPFVTMYAFVNDYQLVNLIRNQLSNWLLHIPLSCANNWSIRFSFWPKPGTLAIFSLSKWTLNDNTSEAASEWVNEGEAKLVGEWATGYEGKRQANHSNDLSDPLIY